VREVLALAGLAHAVALHGLGEDHGGLAGVSHGGVIRSKDLARIVAAAVQLPDVVVGEVRDHRQQLGVSAEEVLPRVGAAARLVVLVVAVDRLLHALEQEALAVPREQRVPAVAPDHLDHVPARAAEGALELLDDLAVATHRAVEALQIAVHHEDQVVELLARGESDRAQRLGLVHLAVAHEAPDLAALHLGEAAVLEVSHEARLEDREDRSEPHRHRRELPEVGHQPGVRIGRQARLADLAPEAVQLFLGETPLEEGAGVDAGRRVPLDVEQIGPVLVVRPLEEVIEADVVERGRARERRDVSAELGVLAIRLHHHRQRVPAHQRADAVLEPGLTRQRRLVAQVDRVEIRRGGGVGQVGARAPRLVDQPLEQVVAAFDPLAPEDRFERVEPLGGLRRIDVGNAIDHAFPSRAVVHL